MSKKMSKTAKLAKNREINKVIQQKIQEKFLKEDRAKADKEDPITVDPLKNLDVDAFNSKNFMDALKNSGADSDNNVFSDMERMLNNNESIRELVDIKNIKMKTNVTEEQHHIIVTLYGSYMALKKWGIEFAGLANLLNEFIVVAPSISGQRADQFVTAHQALAQAVANANSGGGHFIKEPEVKQ